MRFIDRVMALRPRGERAGDFYKRIGASASLVAYWKKANNPTIKTVEQIATVLMVNPGWLAFGEGESPRNI